VPPGRGTPVLCLASPVVLACHISLDRVMAGAGARAIKELTVTLSAPAQQAVARATKEHADQETWSRVNLCPVRLRPVSFGSARVVSTAAAGCDRSRRVVITETATT
jgi:hypothetical protein